ncbi:MAG: amidohydrolase [Corynebacterium sp.]|nr:amidohydrolase [Corynebacterium sp.]
MNIRTHIDRWLEKNRDEVLSWRRYLHAYPELSHQEHGTTAYIAEILRGYGLTPKLFPTTGLMVDIGNPRIAFRGDIDALPIQEETGLPFSSQNPGVMHACGHDVHTTIALAIACALAEYPEPIDVRVIFQPAEEVMYGGAPDVIDWGGIDGIEKIFAVHCEPTLHTGTIGVRAGAITSAADILTVNVHGPGGHTSRPQLTNDVVFALSSVVTQLPALLSRRIDPRTGTVLVFGSIHAGNAANAIPQTGSVSGTLRTASVDVWMTIQPLLEELISQVLAPTGCSFDIDYMRGIPPVVNDPIATHLLIDHSPFRVVEALQSSGGEDFSWYLQKIPGCMVRLGCKTTEEYDLHQSDLIVDEDCIDVGVKLFASILHADRL